MTLKIVGGAKDQSLLQFVCDYDGAVDSFSVIVFCGQIMSLVVDCVLNVRK